MVSEMLERGKVSVSIEYERVQGSEIKQSYNETLFTAYYSELKRLADKVYANYDNVFELALNSPDVKSEIWDLKFKTRKDLNYIIQLFLNLFKFLFHQHHMLLHFSIVRL